MTHRSPYQMFVRTVLAALAIAVGATLTVPVGASAVLVALEPAPQENLAPVPSPASAVSAAQVSQLESGITESSGIAAGLARDPVVHLARSTPSSPSHGPRADGSPVTHGERDRSAVPNGATVPWMPHPSTPGCLAIGSGDDPLEPPQKPATDIIVFMEQFCEAIMEGCWQGCLGGSRVLIASGLLEEVNQHEYLEDCVYRHCKEIAEGCGYEFKINQNDENESSGT